MRRRAAASFLFALAAACGTTPPPQHDQTLALAWMRFAAEYDAACVQAYAGAAGALERALADPTWSACLEQGPADGAARLPAAVVLDVDETVLDNSTYAARQLLAGKGFEPASWAAWCHEQSAGAVPGALAYTRRAVELGIRVVYVTNRRADAGGDRPSTEESDTRANLRQLGFPLDERDGFDCVLTAGEHGDKAARRRVVAERFRVLQLVGDNLGDFAPGVEPRRTQLELDRVAEGQFTDRARDRLVAEFDRWWGARWILLPNPSYGSFESVLKARHGSVRDALVWP
ncbi:MAG: 5'-nucleotidase, lipoprotein e(P4) family [Planctomycetes bacterium]|nr:5'-nucleotidase, lipoprotein e(P4) family [Planctomycetota bacterium]